MEQKLDNLQYSISKLANQLVHQEEEYLEGEWLTDQEDLLQEQVEAPEELPTGEAGGGRGKEAGEEPLEPILQPIPMDLDPNATAQPQIAHCQCTYCQHLQQNQHMQHLLLTISPTHHCMSCKNSRS